MALLPKVKLKSLVSFPATILDGVGIDVVRQNGSFQFDLAFDDFAPPVQGIPPAEFPNLNALLWNGHSNSYSLTPISLFGAPGGILDAPVDGVLYGRRNAAWSAVPTPPSAATVPPLMDGVAAVGVGLRYAREDHAHPTDTSLASLTYVDAQDALRAPLDAPALTGEPTAPTAGVGVNTNQIATTAFVQAAIAEGGTFVDAPSNGTYYGRIDHGWANVAPLNSPALTGTPTAPTPAPADNSTKIATTAWVTTNGTVPPATVAPLMDGVAAVGTATKYAREDHRHPTDTSLAALTQVVRFDAAQTLTGPQQTQARTNINAQIAGSYQPALGFTPVNKAGDTMTGALSAVGLTSNGADVTTARNATQGYVYFGTSGTKYFGYDGTNFALTGGPLFCDNVNGAAILAQNEIRTLSGRIVSQSSTVQSSVGAYAVQYGSNYGFWNGNQMVFGTMDAGGNPTGAYMWMQPAGFTCTVTALKPGGGPWADSSDARIKTVLGDYTSGLEAVAALRPVRYVYKGNDTETEPAHEGVGIEPTEESDGPPSVPYPNSAHYTAATERKEFIGLIAQEAEASMPEMVSDKEFYIDGNLVTDMKILDTTPLIFALINAVKELNARVQALESQ